MKVNTKAVANFDSTKFYYYEHGKGHHKPNKINTTKNNTMNYKYPKKGNIMPGNMVFAYH